LISTLILGKLWASAIPVTVDVAVPTWPARSFDLPAIAILVLVLILVVVRQIEVKVACPAFKCKGICLRHRSRPAAEGCVPMSSTAEAGWADLVPVTLILMSDAIVVVVVVVVITVGIAIPGSVWSHFEKPGGIVTRKKPVIV